MKGPIRTACALLAAVSVLASCGGDAGGGSPSVLLAEFDVIASGAFSAGRVELPVTNGGEFGHTLVVADEFGEVAATTPVIQPGESTTLQVDLEPGAYQFTCRIVIETPDGAIVDHYAEGMVADVVVPET